MNGFTADWLRLREPADSAARPAALIARLRDQLETTGQLRIVDLGTGTGANIRYLAPRLGGPQAWTAVDQDLALLAAAAVDGLRDLQVTHLQLDLALRLDALPLADVDLVTASALLDLVSPAWLAALAARCAAAGAAVLFALTYDGRIDWSPVEPGDDRVHELVNRHQRGDKGFGPALGPAAATAAVEHYAHAGYAVETMTSDWRLGPTEHGLQDALLRGWTDAAIELVPDERPALESWLRRRLAHTAAGRSRVTVGHVDFIGVPPRSIPRNARHSTRVSG